MFIRLVIYILLIICAVQAFPSSNVESEKKELPCLEKIAWYQDVTNSTTRMYDEYHVKLIEAKLPSDALNKLNAEHTEFESTFVVMLHKYDTDTKELGTMSNSTIREILCRGVIDGYRKMNANLTGLASHLKSNVLNIIDHSGIPKDVKGNLNKTLSRIVNFLFITDITKNVFKDASSLIKQSSTTVEDEIALEKEWKIKPNGEVEPVESTVPDYDEKVLNNDKDGDEQLNEELKKLADDAEIKAAEMKNQNNHSGFTSLGLGIGVASVAVLLLAVLVGSVLVWLRSQSYSQFS